MKDPKIIERTVLITFTNGETLYIYNAHHINEDDHTYNIMKDEKMAEGKVKAIVRSFPKVNVREFNVEEVMEGKNARTR